MTSELGISPGITPDVQEMLRAAADAGLTSLPRRGAEIGGLLTSSSPMGRPPLVDHAELIATEHRYGPGYRLSPQDTSELRSRANEIRSRKGPRIVGYFRSCTDDEFTFATSDLDVVRNELPGCRLILIVKPFPDGHAKARVFEPRSGDWTQTDEFEMTRVKAKAPLPPAEAPLKEPRESASVPRRILIYAAVLACVLVTGAAAWMRTRPLEPAGLGVIVEPAGDLLRLTWNRETSAVHSATAAVLRISDGAARRDITLDPQQLSSGSILYRPSSADVTFRLEVRGANRTAGETVRFVSGAPQVPAPVAAQTSSATVLRPIAPAPAPRIFEPPLPALDNTPSRQDNQVLETNPPELKPAEPKVVALSHSVRVEPPREPAPVASAPPAYGRSWEPIPSVMHRLNDTGVTPPRPVLKAMPKVTVPIASATEIRVLVAVDSEGNVAGAQLLDRPATLDANLVKRTMAAARHWKFEPATDHGKPVPATYTVNFRFRPSDR